MKARFAILSMFLLAGTGLFPSKAAGQTGKKLYPVDEAAKDPGFFVFRARLLEAVARKDAEYLLGIVTPNIQNSFGGVGGVGEFKEMWRPEKADSELWPTLAAVLGRGGVFLKGGEFEAPYVCAAFPEGFDPFDYAAIVGENIRVRKEPKAESEVLARLSYDIVPVAEMPQSSFPKEGNWVKIRLKDGKEGYVSGQFVATPVDYRAFFEKKDGNWRMTTLIAGD